MAKIRERLWSKKSRKWTILALAAVALGGFFGFRYWRARKNALPEGIVSGNGRIEAKETDVASKLPLKVKEVFVKEGDLVKPGQVVVQMDTVTLDAELVEAQKGVATAREQVGVARADITRRKSE